MVLTSVDIVNHNPGIITSVATILRLSDDFGSAKVWFLSKNEKTLLFQCKPTQKDQEGPYCQIFHGPAVTISSALILYAWKYMTGRESRWARRILRRVLHEGPQGFFS